MAGSKCRDFYEVSNVNAPMYNVHYASVDDLSTAVNVPRVINLDSPLIVLLANSRERGLRQYIIVDGY